MLRRSGLGQRAKRDLIRDANRAAIQAAVAEAHARDWYSCGDLVSSRLRASHAFKRLPLRERFALCWVEDAESGCWTWVASCKDTGYGQITAGRNRPAHCVSYELHVGRIQHDLEVDHLCFNKRCVNPDHLEPVTSDENVQRWFRAQTKCRNGHPLAEADKSRRGRCPQCTKSVSKITNARRCVRKESVQGNRKLKLTDADVQAMITMRGTGASFDEIALRFGVSSHYTYLIVTGRRVRARRYTGASEPTKALVTARSDGRCEFDGCSEVAIHIHHRRPRRMGGTRDKAANLPANLLALCLRHHDWIESNRALALERGLLVHAEADPTSVPVETRHGWVLLDNVGGWTRWQVTT